MRRPNLADNQTPEFDSPDASLTADDSFTATSSAGLTYPWGSFAPGPGKVHPIAKGISWTRIPMPGSLGHTAQHLTCRCGGSTATLETPLTGQCAAPGDAV